MIAQTDTCSCGKPLVLARQGLEFVMTPAYGGPRIIHDHPDGLKSVYELLAEMRQTILDLKGKAPTAYAAAYSDLSARVDLGGRCPEGYSRTPGLHVHGAKIRWVSGDVPSCHGEPMHYRPDGWCCRQEGCHLPHDQMDTPEAH